MFKIKIIISIKHAFIFKIVWKLYLLKGIKEMKNCFGGQVFLKMFIY